MAYLAYGSLIGTWLSAGCLILDWDRSWQAWPIPCVFGALFGFLCGFVLYLFHPLIKSLIPNKWRLFFNRKNQLSNNNNINIKLRFD